MTIGSGPSGFPETELTDTEDALFDRCDDAYKAGTGTCSRGSTSNCGRSARPATTTTSTHGSSSSPTNWTCRTSNTRGEAPIAIPLDPPAFDRVVDIEVPALVTVGEFDLSEALAQQAYLLDSIPTADGYIFSDTAHLPSVEHPDEFADVLRGWMVRNGL